MAQRAVFRVRSTPLIAPPDDDPSADSAFAAGDLAHAHRDWSVLEDEWECYAVIHTGRRLSPELVVPLLARHRTDATGMLGRW